MNIKKCLYCKSNNDLYTLRCTGCGAQEFEQADYWPQNSMGATYAISSYPIHSASQQYWPTGHKLITRKM